ESVGELRAITETKRDGQLVIAAGCMSQRYAADVPVWDPGVDGVLSTRSWPDIVPFVEGVRRVRDRGSGIGDQESVGLQQLSTQHSALSADVTWAPIAPVQPTAQIKRFRRKAKG